MELTHLPVRSITKLLSEGRVILTNPCNCGEIQMSIEENIDKNKSYIVKQIKTYDDKPLFDMLCIKNSKGEGMDWLEISMDSTPNELRVLKYLKDARETVVDYNNKNTTIILPDGTSYDRPNRSMKPKIYFKYTTELDKSNANMFRKTISRLYKRNLVRKCAVHTYILNPNIFIQANYKEHLSIWDKYAN